MITTKVASSTPETVSIQARHPTFELKEALSSDWMENDPFLTAVFNAMSLSFPSGEKEFIQSVRHYEARITDAKLLQDIRGFYQQEAAHSREHQKYNRLLCEQRGYDLEKLEGIYLRRIERIKKNPFMFPRTRLASTVAAEHFTASMAKLLLDQGMFDHAEPSVRQLWLWHAMEELEHKSVAFDVYTQLAGKYYLRARMMRLTLFFYYVDSLRVVSKMLRHDKQFWKWSTLKSFWRFMFAKDSFVQRFVPAYKNFFREDFHPWDEDSTMVLNRWQNELAVSTH